MDHESSEFECDIWQGIAVLTRKADGAMGQVILKQNGRQATARMIAADVRKHGTERALRTYARLAGVPLMT